jgi:hypothetical protein
MIALGLLRNDCSTETEACEARIAAGASSWHHHVHDVLSGPIFAAAVIAPLLLARALRGDARLHALAPYSLGTAVALAVLFALGGLDAAPGWDGAVQRGAVSLAMLWLEVVALRLLWPTSTAAITPALRS